MKDRSPYDQGWLDGYNQFAKEQVARDKQDSVIVQATTKLQALLDQSARVRALETAVDEARALWTEWSETDITDDDDRWADFTNRVHDWLKRNRKPSQSGERSSPDTAEPAEKQPDSR